MNDEDLKLLAEDLLDFLNELEASVVKLKSQISKLVGFRRGWNPEKIRWEKAEGARGEFEKSEDYNNPEFKALLKDLASHNGKLTRNGWFYWTYKNGSTVGRKRKEAKG